MNKFESFSNETPEPELEQETSAEEISLTKEDAEMIVLNYQSHAAEMGTIDPGEFDHIIESLNGGSLTPQEAIDKAFELAPHETE